MKLIIITYLVVLIFGAGYWFGDPFKSKTWWMIVLWPLTVIAFIIVGVVELWKIYFPPIWLELILVLLFNKKAKADDEPLNKYYNEVKKKKTLFRNYKIKAVKKIAEQNNITLK